MRTRTGTGIFLLLTLSPLTAAAEAPTPASAERKIAATTAVPPQLVEGSPAPNFRLRALDGSMLRLDEIAYLGPEKSYSKKRPLVVDFFRTDCRPCRDSMPELMRLYNEHRSAGFDFVLIALLEQNDGRAKLDRYLRENPVPFKVVIDEAELYARKYLGDPVTLPATFLLDEEGVLRKVKYGATGTVIEIFEEPIRQILAKRIAAIAGASE